MGEVLIVLVVLGGLAVIAGVAAVLTRGSPHDHFGISCEVAEARRYLWEKVLEPQYRSYPGYPPDWEIRRMEVFFLEDGECELCGRAAGHSAVPGTHRWHRINPSLLSPRDRWVSHAHLHHWRPVSQGGDHSLENLELLCGSCHMLKHSKNAGFRVRVGQQRARRMRVGMDAKVKTARRLWQCAGCERDIRKGDRHFGGRYARLCLPCARAHRRFPGE